MCEVENFYKEVNKFKTTTRDGYVLFVDDDKEILNMLKVCARLHNLESKSVSSYEQASGLFKKEMNLIKCAVIDLHLAGRRNGEEVISLIEEQYPQIPYVAYSADEDALIKVKKKHKRATILIKGSSLDNLMNTLGIL